MSKHKVLFVGPEYIHAAFAKMNSNWDLQIPIESVSQLNEELNKDDNLNVDPNTQVIILFSRLFNTNRELFAYLAAWLAPYAVICILTPRNEAYINDEIEREIKNQQSIRHSKEPEYDTNTPVYFCEYENAFTDIMTSISKYVKSPYISEDTKEIISPMVPDDIASLEDEYEDIEEPESNEIVIPPEESRNDSHIICVTSSKGGSGKSTVSILLGSYIAKSSMISYQNGLEKKPLKVCLVDLDVETGQLNLMNKKYSPNILDILLSDNKATEESVKKGIYHSDKLECDFIFTSKRPRSARSIPPQFYVELIQTLTKMYDVIILDTSTTYTNPLLEQVAYPLADQVIFVTDIVVQSVSGMRIWINETTAAPEAVYKLPIEKIGIVVNKVLPSVKMDAADITRAAKDCPILTMIPSQPALIAYATNTVELQQCLFKKSLNVAYKRLAESLIPEEEYKLSDIPCSK